MSDLKQPNDVEVEAGAGDVKVAAKFSGAQAWAGAIGVLALLGAASLYILHKGGVL